MQVTLTIDGRMAIPVRAIPFVTGFELSPDELAELASAPTTLSRYVGSAVLEFENRQRLATFTLDAASGYRAMTPRDWEFSKVEIQCLGQKLKAAERDEGENWAEWRRLAITALPHACFVWLDDFAEWHQQNRPHCMPRKPENLRDGEFMELLANGPSPDMDDEVIDRIELAPFIPREFESLIVEGFEAIPTEPDSESTFGETTDSNEQSSAPIGLFVTKQELIDGLQLHEKKWDGILSKVDSDGKRYMPALVMRGRKGPPRAGKPSSALWNPITFACLAVEHHDLNQMQVVARFKKAWPQWQDELASAMGE